MKNKKLAKRLDAIEEQIRQRCAPSLRECEIQQAVEELLDRVEVVLGKVEAQKLYRALAA